MNIIEAMRNRDLALVKELLVVNGADVNARDNDGRTALTRYCKRSKLEVADYLKQKGAKE